MELADGLRAVSTQPYIQESFAKSKYQLYKANMLLFSISVIVAKNDDRYKYSSKEVLIEACSETREIGSSTCVVVTLDETQPILYTANIGDSGYLLLRKSGLDLVSYHRSKEQ